MDAVIASLYGIIPFILYFLGSIAALLVFSKLYAAITPHDEMELMRNNNTAAAIAYVGALIGFAIPVASAAANSVSLLDFGIWVVVAAVAQLAVFFVFRLTFPKISERIQAGELAVPLKLACWSVVIGILNAAAITY